MEADWYATLDLNSNGGNLNNQNVMEQCTLNPRSQISHNRHQGYVQDFVDDNGMIYWEVRKGMYGLPQAGVLSSG